MTPEDLKDAARAFGALSCLGGIWFLYRCLEHHSRRPLTRFLRRRAIWPLLALGAFLTLRIWSESAWTTVAINLSLAFYIALSERGEARERTPQKQGPSGAGSEHPLERAELHRGGEQGVSAIPHEHRRDQAHP